MSLALTQTKTALGPNLLASFLGTGGTPPYVYSVLPSGAGGSINSSTGFYTAPSTVPTNPATSYDTIQVTDAASATATAQILVASPLLLFCDIIQSELGLSNGRVFLWDQKIFQPTDNGLYIPISVPVCKPFGNNIKPAIIANKPDWSQAFQVTNFMATLDINAISRDTSALTRKEEIIMALASVYSEQQQENNSFYIARIPPNASFKNLSLVDGAAIPYRYQISVNIQYAVTKQKAVDYFGSFPGFSTVVNA